MRTKAASVLTSVVMGAFGFVVGALVMDGASNWGTDAQAAKEEFKKDYAKKFPPKVAQ